jgi:hypothetical protein
MNFKELIFLKLLSICRFRDAKDKKIIPLFFASSTNFLIYFFVKFSRILAGYSAMKLYTEYQLISYCQEIFLTNVKWVQLECRTV